MTAYTTTRHNNSKKNAMQASKPAATKTKGKEKENGAADASQVAAKVADENAWDVWNWSSLNDPSSSRIPPIFSKDGNYFFSLSGSVVKIYSTSTGSVVSTLVAPFSPSNVAGAGTLTGAVINPQNVFQLIVASLDGRLLIWDFVSARLLQTITVGQPIHYICAHEQSKGSVSVVASRTKKSSGDNHNVAVLQVHLKSSDGTQKQPPVTAIGKARSPTGLAISANGSWLVVTGGYKVYIAKMSDLAAGFTKYVSPDRITCLAFHPTEEYFATGDTKGVVRLWYCLNDSLAISVKGVEKRTHTRSLHWHAHAVSSLAFTRNGAYLLSGGEESVLVVWQLETGKKEFIPRIGAPISTITVRTSSLGEEEYLVGLADATYVFVSAATLKVTRTYSRVKTDPALSYEWPSTSKITSLPLAAHPLSSTLILPSSHPSSVQIYSPSSSTLVSELEISPSNRVSRKEDKPVRPARVEKVTISSLGEWMATIDHREGDLNFQAEIYLKLWQWAPQSKAWVLHTRINRPHGTSFVTDLKFGAQGTSLPLFLVTTGGDGGIKVWRFANKASSDGSVGIWASHATLSFRTEIPRSVSWSPDSSVFAVAVGSQVALYDATTGTLRQTLNVTGDRNIKTVSFIGSIGRYLLVAGHDYLVMWDVISNTVCWQRSTPFPIERIVPCATRPEFVVIFAAQTSEEGDKTHISVFRALSLSPIANKIVPFQLRSAVWNELKSGVHVALLGLTSTWKLVEFGDNQEPSYPKDVPGPAEINPQSLPHRRTLFQDIFGESAFAETPAEVEVASSSSQLVPKSGDKVFDAAFSQPTFLCPALSDMFDPLLDSFLSLRTSSPEVGTEPAGGGDEDEDVMMEDETVIADQVPSTRVPGNNEMELFTQLFKMHCRTSPLAKSAHKKPNGVVSDVQRTETVPTHKTATPQKQRDQEADAVTMTTPLGSGRKRKKAPS